MKHGNHLFLGIATTALLLCSRMALGNPPPAGSDEEKKLGAYAGWFQSQNSAAFGSCCSLADGRIVVVEIRDNQYWVRFVHPETITVTPKPVAGEYYPVPPEAILHGTNPTGYPIAWWAPLYRDGAFTTNIRCFSNADEY